MIIYSISTRNGSPSYATHEGMSEDTVRQLLADLGCTDITFVTEEEYRQVSRPPQAPEPPNA